MASYVCGELPRSYTGSGSQKKLIRTFSVKWDIGTVTAAMTEAVLLLEFGIGYGVGHPELPGAVTTDIAHDVDSDNPGFWETVVTYELNRKERDDKQRDVADPKERPPRVSVYWETTRVPVPDERDGTIIKNSAGQVPDPRIEVDGDMTGFHIEGDEYPMPPWIFTYRTRRGVINSQPFKVRLETGQLIDVGSGNARLRNLRSSTLQYENGFPHYQISFDLLIQEGPSPVRVSRDGWVFDQVDCGTMQIAEIPDGSGMPIKLKHILDASGSEVTSPVLLNGAGQPIEDPSTEEPFVFYRDVYESKPFGGVLPACVI